MSSVNDTLELLASKTPKWMRWARCADSDPALFHLEPGEDNTERIEMARKICEDCPVRVECLMWAFETDDHFAILGGKTGYQRARIATQIAKLMEGSDFLLDIYTLLAAV